LYVLYVSFVRKSGGWVRETYKSYEFSPFGPEPRPRVRPGAGITDRVCLVRSLIPAFFVKLRLKGFCGGCPWGMGWS